MGLRRPAVLLRETVNVEHCGKEHRERLSTRRYTLVVISCKGCYRKLGWHYLCAVSPVGLPSPALCIDCACMAEAMGRYILVDTSCCRGIHTSQTVTAESHGSCTQ